MVGAAAVLGGVTKMTGVHFYFHISVLKTYLLPSFSSSFFFAFFSSPFIVFPHFLVALLLFQDFRFYSFRSDVSVSGQEVFQAVLISNHN